MIPGEIETNGDDLTLNEGRERLEVRVANSGDRPVQIGSHYHFAEANPALQFDRQRSRGFRLDIPAGSAVRFEPGASRNVSLVAFGGARVVQGFRGEVMGPLDDEPQMGPSQ